MHKCTIHTYYVILQHTIIFWICYEILFFAFAIIVYNCYSICLFTASEWLNFNLLAFSLSLFVFFLHFLIDYINQLNSYAHQFWFKHIIHIANCRLFVVVIVVIAMNELNWQRVRLTEGNIETIFTYTQEPNCRRCD